MNKKIGIFILFTIAVFVAASFFRKAEAPSPEPIILSNENNEVVAPIKQKINLDFTPPLDRAQERVTKKPFSILIDPKTSPVQPEKFSGYHTGVDFEIFPEELDTEVVVHSVCSGKVRSARYINGYGGVVIQDCLLDEKNIAVLYGHLKLSSVDLEGGNSLSAGETVGVLGKAYSQETSGERKHLHLSFHSGSVIDVRGYVSNKKDLSNWIDPCLYVCAK